MIIDLSGRKTIAEDYITKKIHLSREMCLIVFLFMCMGHIQKFLLKLIISIHVTSSCDRHFKCSRLLDTNDASTKSKNYILGAIDSCEYFELISLFSTPDETLTGDFQKLIIFLEATSRIFRV